MKNTNNITACLWFDDQGEEAVNFYTSVFDNAKITATTHYPKDSGEQTGKVLTVAFKIENFSFLALNGGSQFKKNPSISFFVNCDSKEEVDKLWGKLMDGGKELMPLDQYPFAARYGWVEDKYGVSWQVMFGDKPEGDWRPKIIPSLMFTQENTGKAQEAIRLYTSIFKDAKTGMLSPYPEDAPAAKKGDLAFGDFQIEKTWIGAMDSGTEQPFSFSEGISIMVHCENQKEIDDYWEALTANGGEEGKCGWLKDKYGVSWQIIPRNLGEILSSSAAVHAMMQMKKLYIRTLKEANNE